MEREKDATEVAMVAMGEATAVVDTDEVMEVVTVTEEVMEVDMEDTPDLAKEAITVAIDLIRRKERMCKKYR